MEQKYPKATANNNNLANPKFSEIETGVLKFWNDNKIFQKSLQKNLNESDNSNEFIFYDGPPFANGLPHYGHLLTGYVKDSIARYKTQTGKYVKRRFGWDTHGLPAELEAMKQLGMADKEHIETMGIDKFNEACRISVMQYAKQWQEYVSRQARWVDFENDYKTLNIDYMESVLWAFKTLYEKNLVYSSYRVLPYCWKDETPLSNHELRMDEDVYKTRQDQTVTVNFPIKKNSHKLANKLFGVYALAWTTTPWTLPTNLALAVGNEIKYSVLPSADTTKLSNPKKFLIAHDLLKNYYKDLGYETLAEAQAAVLENYLGSELVGLAYEPIFDTYTDTQVWKTQKAWHLIAADYVTTTDGTGIVHQAPAYGEEDQKICEQNGIPTIISIDDSAKFLPIFSGTILAEIVGVQVFDANKTIIKILKKTNRLLKQNSYEHSYPHCWRCRNPLIYRAVSSWFVSVHKIKDRMIALNQEINWIPNNVKDGQFGKWLENARDWSISRNRYWGTPIPIWISDDPDCPRIDVYGSLAEIENDFGRLPKNHQGEIDLHRPFIDNLTRINPNDPTGKSVMRRVPDVLDVWFDSGSMPYAQIHYPMENTNWFDENHTGDFIVEYIGQTRGWFYTLHILSTALFDRPAFRNAISHGIVLGSDGHKMSKSLKNYPDVFQIFNSDGSDAMRWFLLSSSVLRGGNLIVHEKQIRDSTRQTILPFWNTWYFFSLYANAALAGQGYVAKLVSANNIDQLDVLDKYLLSKTGILIENVTTAFETYHISDACEMVRTYLDMLTNWYIRRSRQRFFEEDFLAFDTLFTCLETVSRILAPLLPLISEEVWRGLTGKLSVHLADWPNLENFSVDKNLVACMDKTRQICSVILGLRKTANLRVRLPLAQVTIVLVDAHKLKGKYVNIISQELNIKKVSLLDVENISETDFGISKNLVINARALGPRLGKDVQKVISCAKKGQWLVEYAENGTELVTVAGFVLQSSEYVLETAANSLEQDSNCETAILPGGGFVILDTKITSELETEGMVRDIIRVVQQKRREADFEVSDRINLQINIPKNLHADITFYEKLICKETLAKNLTLVAETVGKENTIEVGNKVFIKVRVSKNV